MWILLSATARLHGKSQHGLPDSHCKRDPGGCRNRAGDRRSHHVDGKEYHMTAVSMGNPHAIIYVDDVNSLDLEKIGPSFENHVCFPDRVNTEFVQVIDRHTVKMRVWERGSGETLACGTGACAVTVASILNDKVDGSKPVTVQLLGGDLNISWERDENLVYMTGPATTVFDGEIDLGFLGE